MADKQQYDKDKKKKRTAKDFRQLEEIKEKKTNYTNKEISVIHCVEEERTKNEEGKI